jgi:hypothetical protein
VHIQAATHPRQHAHPLPPWFLPPSPAQQINNIKFDYLFFILNKKTNEKIGDIGYPNEESYRAYLLEQADRFEHVFVVAGNHEYYHQESVQHADQLIVPLCVSSTPRSALPCGV